MKTLFSIIGFILLLLCTISPAAHGQASKPTAVLLVDTDDTCRLTVDDQDEGVITPDQSKKLNVGLGDHLVKCVVEGVPDLMWRKVVAAKSSEQAAVIIALKALHIQYDQAVGQSQEQKQQVGAAKEHAATEEKQKTHTLASLEVDSLRQNAQSGDVSAEMELGRRYSSGEGGVTQDWVQARAWFQKAADQGDANAENYMGLIYMGGGLGLAKDFAQARAWMQKAVDHGRVASNYQIGLLYQYGGPGVPKDDAQALQWFQKAADRGDASSQNSLGFLYEHGQGVGQDYARARFWYKKAADQGSILAQQRLAALDAARQ